VIEVQTAEKSVLPSRVPEMQLIELVRQIACPEREVRAWFKMPGFWVSVRTLGAAAQHGWKVAG
jgi:hypothetical protein